ILPILRTARHASVYTTCPLPEEIFGALTANRVARGSDSVEFVVEGISEIEYLRSLHGAGFSLFYGVGLPPGAVILLDRERAFRLIIDAAAHTQSWRELNRGGDLYMALLWHRFGLAFPLPEKSRNAISPSIFFVCASTLGAINGVACEVRIAGCPTSARALRPLAGRNGTRAYSTLWT
ncbi:MAG TPA: hypothetical protein VLA17_11295, partial [Candidatus Limnocylindria bacterium]|nr:hypothetical protein [Candidatus Limnocylindria bacterium]